MQEQQWDSINTNQLVQDQVTMFNYLQPLEETETYLVDRVRVRQDKSTLKQS